MNKYLNLNRLEYAVTYQCSSNCRHCFVEDTSGARGHIDADIAVHLLREVGRRYALSSVMTFGGEPLLYPEVVCAIHREAKALGIPQRQVITNGYWTKDEDRTHAIAQSLARSGVNGIAFSVDAFHQEYVPLERVKCSARALWDAGIRDIHWNPCWLVSKEDDNAYDLKTRAILDELEAFLPVRTGSGNVMEPQGRARKNFAEHFQLTFDWSRTSCQDMPYLDKLDDVRCLCVEPNGDVPVCGLLLGNVAHDDVGEMLERYDPYADPYARLILEEGIEGVLHKARTFEIDLRKDGYYSICDLCGSVRQELRRRLAGEN